MTDLCLNCAAYHPRPHETSGFCFAVSERPYFEVSESHPACEKYKFSPRIPEMESERARAGVLCRMALYHLRNINPHLFNAFDFMALEEAIDAVEDLVRCFPERTTTVKPEQIAP